MSAGHASTNPSVESHVDSLEEPTRAIFSDLRRFVLSLGTNVIEQPRPHRIAYSKTLNLRIFLEVMPSADKLLLTIRYGRAGPPLSLELSNPDQLADAKKAIADAFERIQ